MTARSVTMSFEDWDRLEAYRDSNPDGADGDGWPDEKPDGVHPDAWLLCVDLRRLRERTLAANAKDRARRAKRRELTRIEKGIDHAA